MAFECGFVVGPPNKFANFQLLIYGGWVPTLGGPSLGVPRRMNVVFRDSGPCHGSTHSAATPLKLHGR